MTNVQLRQRVSGYVREHPEATAAWLMLAVAIAIYIVAYASKSIYAYRIGVTLFDLAVFEQAFWNATQGTLFYSSLEGDISHFGRHFSPFLILLLPFYMLHRDPTTLLILQSVALGLAAIPLYLVAQKRLNSSAMALVIAFVYLASPVVHDINIVNEFHEVAFAVPLLFLAFHALETRRWWLYGLSVLGALMVKEDVALIVAALGLYVVAVERRYRIGAATVVAAVVWFVVVMELVIPWFRGSAGSLPVHGYEYLGDGTFGIATGILTQPGDLLEVMTSEPKQQYLKWLFLPVGFIALLAPRVLFIAVPGLLLVLASTHPPTYRIFERYIAPALPFVFLAAVVGVEQLSRVIRHVIDRLQPEASKRWQQQLQIGVAVLVLVPLVLGTVYTQRQLQKYPDRLIHSGQPSAHAAIAIGMAEAIPRDASAVIEDHRLLDRAAHRRHLYYLAPRAPFADYVLIDRRVGPITHVPAEDRAVYLEQVVDSGDYLPLRCEDGLALYVRESAYSGGEEFFGPYEWQHEHRESIGSDLLLHGYDLAVPPLDESWDPVRISLHWESQGAAVTHEDQVIIQFVDSNGVVLLEHRETFGQSCATANWQAGVIVPSWHQVPVTGEVLASFDQIWILVADEAGPLRNDPVRLNRMAP